MHLLVPFAAALSSPGAAAPPPSPPRLADGRDGVAAAAAGRTDGVAATLPDVPLPNLSRLLGLLDAGARDDGDAYSLSPPHERALAAAWGWQPAADGCLPFAAQRAMSDGIDPGGRAWGLLTPVHWHVGREHITLADPAVLALSDAESRTAFEAIRPLFESEGWALAYGGADRWYAAHPSLAELPCASLDRVIGRNVDLWLTPGPKTRLLRRLQNEVQMLLYQHPLNDQRAARGALPLNSFWVSGCGHAQLADTRAVEVDDRLRAPLLAGDAAGWAEAWQALDASALAAALAAAERGEPVSLTLCGERGAQRFDGAGGPRSRWRKWGDRLNARFNAVEPAALLAAL